MLKVVRSIAAKLSLTLMSLLILAIVLELGTRAFTEVSPPLLRNHPILGTTFAPDFKGSVFVNESQQHVDLRFNRDGVRGKNRSVAKPDNVKRIAILGDSMVAAIGVSEEHTAVSELESRLAHATGSDEWEVMNFGVSGSATGQELVLYRELVRNYEPDIVVCAFCIWNDFSDNSRHLSSSPHRVYFELNDNNELVQIPLPQGKSKLTSWLNAYSRFYVWQKHAVRVAASRTKSKVGNPPTSRLVYVSNPSKELEASWQLTERLIGQLRDEVEADGSHFVFAILPSADQLHDENWNSIEESFGGEEPELSPVYPSNRLSDFCQREGIPTINMVEAFRNAAPHRSRNVKDEWLHYGGIGHFNRKGNSLAAAQIYDFLMRPSVSQRPQLMK